MGRVLDMQGFSREEDERQYQRVLAFFGRAPAPPAWLLFDAASSLAAVAVLVTLGVLGLVERGGVLTVASVLFLQGVVSLYKYRKRRRSD